MDSESCSAETVHQRAVQLLQERQQPEAAAVLAAFTVSMEADASGSVVALALQTAPARDAATAAAAACYLDPATSVRSAIATALRDALPAGIWIESLVLLDSPPVNGRSGSSPASTPAATPTMPPPQPSRVHIAEAHNQATGFQMRREWRGLRFRSESELRIAQALERAEVLFLPNCKARLGSATGRTTREPDFLVCSRGKWGILEVDGEPYHPAERTATEHERDRVLKQHGVRVVEHFDAARCFATPDVVVREFLGLLDNA